MPTINRCYSSESLCGNASKRLPCLNSFVMIVAKEAVTATATATAAAVVDAAGVMASITIRMEPSSEL